MGRVTAIKIEGIDCWFPSLDHRPPHFHAKRRGRWEYRVFFLNKKETMLEVKWEKYPISRLDRRLICNAAEANREKLLLEWEEKVISDG